MSRLAQRQSDETVLVRLRIPLNGPFIGSVYRDKAGVLRISVSFRIDDRFSDSTSDSDNLSRVWAFARYRLDQNSPYRRVVALEIFDAYGNHNLLAEPVLRVAHGELDIADIDEPSQVQIECFSIHKVLIGEGVSIPGELETVLLEDLESPVTSSNLEQQLDSLVSKLETRLSRYGQIDSSDPVKSVSRLVLYPQKAESRLAQVPANAIAQLAPQAEEAESTNFVVGSCRYPGFRIEHRRVDAWMNNLVDITSAEEPAFGLLLGDQIYADATAGFADSLSPNERFIQRHRYAFARAHKQSRSAWFGDWLTTLPIFMIPDDHEFTDGYPDGPPFLKTDIANLAASQAYYKKHALAALQSYQQLQSLSSKHENAAGVWHFKSGPARFLLLDTRSERSSLADTKKGQHSILTKAQRAAIKDWLNNRESSTYLNVLVTGSVVLPGLAEHDDPSNPGRRDNFQANPRDRDFVLKQFDSHVAKNDQFKFLLLSGDYHLSSACLIRKKTQPIGVAIVAPPFYAPMPFVNTSEHGLWIDERLSTDWSLTNLKDRTEHSTEESPWAGCGIGLLRISRSQGAEYRYKIEYRVRLWRPELDDTTEGYATIHIAEYL